MLSRVKVLIPLALLIAGTAGARAIDNKDVTVNVEAMIGEATLVRELEEGTKDTVIVPTGKTTQQDPTTGQTLVMPSTIANRVNEVVRVIAATSPDATNRRPTDEGCSQNAKPLRLTPNPQRDEATAAFIAEQLEAMSPGELMMVVAVLANNASHLCIDSSTVAATVAVIAHVRPEESKNVLLMASVVDPDNADKYTEIVQPAPTDPASPPIVPEVVVPPGGSVGAPPSPE